MIDLHTHSLLSDGELVPSELVRRAQVAGYKAIAITDHVDSSNIASVISSAVRVADVLNKYWDIFVIPGVEITHVPLECFGELTDFARSKGAKIVVAHGESPVEPVMPGTNKAAIEAGVDILAHPGKIKEEEALLASEKGIHLEITCRKGHSDGNKHVFDISQRTGARLVLDTDAHSPDDLMNAQMREEVFSFLTDSRRTRTEILSNSEKLVEKIRGVL
ncbi:MAG: histidinol phosphate phosphatase domain-containing protein [Candidatus Omnitrophica bacterium]|nr:histidinol phosphate phosphatase domain-containing protein [Candidatus Omnitrophota bacterium]